MQNNIGVIYARFSSHNQREESIEQQVAECRAFAASNGITIIGVYSDEARSAKAKGRSDRRPDFQRLRRDVEKGKFSIILAYKSNRIYRDMLHALVFEEEVSKYGVKILYAKEEFGNNAAGRFALRSMMNVNQFHSENMAEDIRRNQADNARNCKSNGPAPYGYQSDKEGHFVLVEDQAAVVREIFERTAKGDAFVDIADELNRRGIKTRQGNTWGKSSFQTILRNERYLGVYIFDDTRIEGGMPAIISKELFMAVQQKLSTKKNPQGRHRDTGDYLLTGKLYCGDCGEHMIGKSGTARNGSVHYYYSCTGHLSGKCEHKAIRRDMAERKIAAAIRDKIMREDAINWIADQVDAYKRKHKESAKLRALSKQLSSVKKSEANLLSAIEQGIISKTVTDRMRELEAEEKDLSCKIVLERSRTFRVTREQVITWLRSLAGGDVNDPQYRRTLFDNFLIRAYLYDGKPARLILNLFGDQSSVVDCDPSTLSGDPLPPADGSHKVENGSPKNRATFVARFFYPSRKRWHIITHGSACISSRLCRVFSFALMIYKALPLIRAPCRGFSFLLKKLDTFHRRMIH